MQLAENAKHCQNCGAAVDGGQLNELRAGEPQTPAGPIAPAAAGIGAPLPAKIAHTRGPRSRSTQTAARPRAVASS
jgi:hypothetical protein